MIEDAVLFIQGRYKDMIPQHRIRFDKVEHIRVAGSLWEIMTSGMDFK